MKDKRVRAQYSSFANTSIHQPCPTPSNILRKHLSLIAPIQGLICLQQSPERLAFVTIRSLSQQLQLAVNDCRCD